jgi:hypothetical protein
VHGAVGIGISTADLLAGAIAAGYGPAGLTRPALDARVIGSLETNQPVTGLPRDAYSPGLMAGHGGMVYQLLRLHQDCDLPSALTLGEV